MEKALIIHKVLIALNVLMSLLVLFGFICIGKSASPRKILLNAYENICMQAKKQQ